MLMFPTTDVLNKKGATTTVSGTDLSSSSVQSSDKKSYVPSITPVGVVRGQADVYENDVPGPRIGYFPTTPGPLHTPLVHRGLDFTTYAYKYKQEVAVPSLQPSCSSRDEQRKPHNMAQLKHQIVTIST